MYFVFFHARHIHVRKIYWFSQDLINRGKIVNLSRPPRNAHNFLIFYSNNTGTVLTHAELFVGVLRWFPSRHNCVHHQCNGRTLVPFVEVCCIDRQDIIACRMDALLDLFCQSCRSLQKVWRISKRLPMDLGNVGNKAFSDWSRSAPSQIWDGYFELSSSFGILDLRSWRVKKYQYKCISQYRIHNFIPRWMWHRRWGPRNEWSAISKKSFECMKENYIFLCQPAVILMLRLQSENVNQSWHRNKVVISITKMLTIHGRCNIIFGFYGIFAADVEVRALHSIVP